MDDRQEIARLRRELAALQGRHDQLVTDVLGAGSVGDARRAAERAYLALHPVRFDPTAPPPMVMDRALRAQLALGDQVGAVEARGRAGSGR